MIQEVEKSPKVALCRACYGTGKVKKVALSQSFYNATYQNQMIITRTHFIYLKINQTFNNIIVYCSF